MTGCEMTRNYVDAWEEGRDPGPDGKSVKDHILTCQSCSERYAALLELFAREDGAVSPGRREPLSPGFTAGIMAALEPAVPGRRSTLPWRATIAAACLVLVAGIGLGVMLSRRSGETVTVRFVLQAREAGSVHLAGDFNEWDTESFAMHRMEDGSTWELVVPLRKSGVYVYNFIVDGVRWIPDPEAPVRIDDGFGGSGSLLRL